MRRVYFFQCQDFFGKSVYFPYASGCLWAYAMTDPAVAENFVLGDLYFEKLPLHEYLCKMQDPDVVLFGCYGWNTEYHLAMAKLIKQQWPRALIVAGGPNVNQSPEWHAANPFIDISIWGEGEHAVKKILTARTQGIDYHHIPGVAQLIDEQWLHTPAASRSYEYEEFPSPYLTGLFDDFFQRYSYNFNVILETNRGCPYQCTFCDIGKSYFNKVRQFPIERILAEIDWFSEKQIEYLDVADSNFGILPRDIDIAKYIKQKKEATGWPKKMNATFAKNNQQNVFEISLVLNGINRTGITLALQSSNDIVLKNIKRKNFANTKLKEIVDLYEKHHILTYHEFINGLPGETLDSWKKGLLEIIDINPEGFIQGNSAEIYTNAEFMDPAYLARFQIGMRRLPIRNFWVKPSTGNQIPLEHNLYVVSTADMDEWDFCQADLFRIFLSTMHSHGWFRSAAELIADHQSCQCSKVYHDLWHWIQQDSGFISSIMGEIFKEVQSMFAGTGTWGRRIFGANDINWDYDSAMCIEFERNRTKFFADVRRFIRTIYPNVAVDDMINYNNLQVRSFFETYPRQIGRWAVHNSESYSSFQEYCVEIYWHGRRLKKWRLDVTDLSQQDTGISDHCQTLQSVA